MLEGLFGSPNKEKVLLFLHVRQEGYPSEVVRFFAADLRSIQNQFNNLENAGIICSRKVGRTLLYKFNPRYPFLAELKGLLDKALVFYPEEDKQRLLITRKRPRKRDKPL